MEIHRITSYSSNYLFPLKGIIFKTIKKHSERHCSFHLFYAYSYFCWANSYFCWFPGHGQRFLKNYQSVFLR